MKKWLTPVVMIIAVLVIGFYVITAWLARKKSDEILQSFKKIDAHIDSSNKELQKKMDSSGIGAFTATGGEYNYTKLQLEVTPEEATKLKLLERATAAYNKYLDSLKQAFKAGMTSEQNITFSKDFFQKDGNGAKLFWKMQGMKDVFASVAASDSIRQKVSDMGLQIVNGEPVNNANTFTTAYFSNTPAIAVLTILSSFQHNSINSERAILKDYSNLVQLRKTK